VQGRGPFGEMKYKTEVTSGWEYIRIPLQQGKDQEKLKILKQE
jgi:hypothetical protein